MDLKNKLRSLLSDIKETPHKPIDEDSFDFFDSPAVGYKKEAIDNYPSDPEAQRDILESIEVVHYQCEEDNFDAGEHEILKYGDNFDLSQIDGDRKRLTFQLKAVSKKFSDLVLENHPAYASELQRVLQLRVELQAALNVCNKSRLALSDVQYGTSSAALSVITNQRKRLRLYALLRALKTIGTLEKTDVRLHELLQEGDFPSAIQLCQECHKAAATFKQYNCISELSNKLQDTLESIEEGLDEALSSTSVEFESSKYARVNAAYSLLGKVPASLDQLLMHFTGAIQSKSSSIVHGYAQLCAGTKNLEDLATYSDLCKTVTQEVFAECLRDLCRALWSVMKNYHKTLKWHIDQPNKLLLPLQTSAGTTQEVIGESGDSSSDWTASSPPVLQKLRSGCLRIWNEIQQKVKLFLTALDLSNFKYEQIIEILDSVNRLMHVGQEFCQSSSDILHQSLRQQILNYFKNYHSSRLEELKMFLESEGWDLVPIKASFSILQLHEFKFLRMKNLESKSTSLFSDQETKYFEKYIESGSPFDKIADDNEIEDVLDCNGSFSPLVDSDSDSEIADELKQDFIDEKTGYLPQSHRYSGVRRCLDNAPLTSNTSLHVCRLFGKYLQMVAVLKPISYDVIVCMSQLFDFYLYVVFKFFATDIGPEYRRGLKLGSALEVSLARIRDHLIQQLGGRQLDCNLSHAVNLAGQDTLHGLPERTIATESVLFLASQLQFLQPYLESMIPHGKLSFLQQFFSQTVVGARDIRMPVYRTVGALSLNLPKLLNEISLVGWEIEEIRSQHNSYVDSILREVQLFHDRLVQVCKCVPVPSESRTIIWQQSQTLIYETLVEGYSLAKKCSQGGRALMQLDLQHFLTQLEKLLKTKPASSSCLVEVYIKGYYLPEEKLETWLQEHSEYTSRQLVCLVNSMVQINKKSKQRIVAGLSENIMS